MMCTAVLDKRDGQQKSPSAATPAGRFTQRIRRDRFLPLKIILGIFCLLAIGLALQTWLNPEPIAAALYPTATPTIVRPTRTPTPFPTETPVSDMAGIVEETSPTATPTMAPTATPQEPRFHQISSGETLISIALFYGVGVDSLIETNAIDPSTLQPGQSIQIPWPTPTPPLEPVEVEINGSVFVADPTDCEQYEVQSGDSLFGISIRYGIDLLALLAANRLNEQVVINPGDTVCIPSVYEQFIFTDEEESAEFNATPTPAGPRLLYPQPDAQISNDTLVLQWLAQKDLAADEMYMVEVTNLSDFTSHPHRAYTRQTSFQVLDEWKPSPGADDQYRWRVRIVRITGERDDGDYIFAPGGPVSEDSFFNWNWSDQ